MNRYESYNDAGFKIIAIEKYSLITSSVILSTSSLKRVKSYFSTK